MTIRHGCVRAALAAVLGFYLLAVGHGLDAADGSYLLAVDPAVLDSVLSSHGLVVVDDDQAEHGVYRVGDRRQRDTASALADVRSDVLVRGFEVNRARIAAERARGLVLDQSTDAILETLGSEARVTFGGATVPRAYVQQPAAALVGLPAAHAHSEGGGLVAIIDTGVDPLHPALQGVLVPGYDFTRDEAGSASEWPDVPAATAAVLQQSTDAILEGTSLVAVNQSVAAALHGEASAAVTERPLPSAFGHGTMVAGLVHLAAPRAAIMPLKVFRADGTAALYDIVRAVYYAVDHGARVINMSFSVGSASLELERAVSYAYEKGAVLVSSAGNSGRFVEKVHPASSGVVIGVASTSNTDLRSSFSNYGNDAVNVAAPGEALLTTYPGGGYALVWGTSFSAALASGGAALLVRGAEENPHDEAERIQESVLLGAQPVGQSLGSGRLDLARALEARLRKD